MTHNTKEKRGFNLSAQAVSAPTDKLWRFYYVSATSVLSNARKLVLHDVFMVFATEMVKINPNTDGFNCDSP